MLTNAWTTAPLPWGLRLTSWLLPPFVGALGFCFCSVTADAVPGEDATHAASSSQEAGPGDSGESTECVGGNHKNLRDAIHAGCVSCVEKLIGQGEDVNAPLDSGPAPLIVAVSEMQTAVAHVLLARGADVRCRDSNGRTPLHLAAWTGDLVTLRELLRAGASVDSQDKEENRPLHYAAAHGDEDVIEVLLAAGARTDRRNNSDETPFHWFACIELPLAKEMYREPFLGAGLLLLKGSGITAPELVRARMDYRGMTLLHWAAWTGDLRFAGIWIKRGATLDLADATGATPLALAAEAGHAQMIRLLAANGADVNTADRTGLTPLARAARLNPKGGAAQALLAEGADIDLLAAACLGLAERAKAVLRRYPAAVGARDQNGYTALDLALAHRRAGVAQVLIEKGCLSFAHHGTRWRTAISPLPRHLAEKEVVATALKHMHLAGVRDSEDRTPLHYAVASGQLSTVRQLIEAGAKTSWEDAAGNTVLHEAARHGDVPIITFLIGSGGDVSARNVNGLTAGEVAKRNGHVDAARILGVDVGE